MNTAPPTHPPARGHRRNRLHATLKLWGWPVALSLLTASGLVSALVSDGWGDRWAWFALGVPVLVIAWHGLRR